VPEQNVRGSLPCQRFAIAIMLHVGFLANAASASIGGRPCPFYRLVKKSRSKKQSPLLVKNSVMVVVHTCMLCLHVVAATNPVVACLRHVHC